MQNLKRSTKVTKDTEKNLTAQEVQDILRVSSKVGVTRLTFRGLDVEFGPGRGKTNTQVSVKTAPSVAAAAENIEKNTLEQDEFAVKEQQLSELVLTDPEHYEKLMEIGELDERERTAGEAVEE